MTGALHYYLTLQFIKVLKQAEQHVIGVQKERSYYRSVVNKSKDDIKRAYSQTGEYIPPSPLSLSVPNSIDLTVHYSFDFAQQLHYPANPLQPGPVYFLTPRKCAIFGVCCEGIPRQINYLIDEAVDTGKGANTVISLLHHFFENHGLGETHVHLHADNCVGQNKNNAVIQVSIK